MTRDEMIKTLFENMSVAKRGMHARMQSITNDYPISHTQLELLFTIEHLQPVSFKQLAHKLHLTPGAISQLVDSLTQQSLVERETDPNDRRVQCLRLSKKASEMMDAIKQHHRNVLNRVVQDLTTEELTVWMRIQQKMIAEFQTADIKKDVRKETNA
jgi:MarR family multiple antibiotic resistance transcriptional regulator